MEKQVKLKTKPATIDIRTHIGQLRDDPPPVGGEMGAQGSLKFLDRSGPAGYDVRTL